jgi:serine protease Do
MLSRNILFPALLILAGLSARAADTLQLKDQSAIVGQIVVEKPDQIAIDIGYTVLVVPRNQIVGVTKSDAPKPDKAPAAPAPSPAAESKTSLFQAAGSATPDRSVRELVILLGESVVQIRTPSGLGSGFIISEDGFLITNFHVIEGETQLSVEVYHQKGGQFERKTYKEIKIVAMNKFQDITLLKIEDKDAPRFARVLLGDSDGLSVGDRVFAIGSPLGLERTVTEGILSTKTRQLAGALYLQTTAQINPGNSGGPLFNLRGEVIGITNMKMTFGEGLGFAIPIEAVKFFLNHRDAYAYDNDNPSSGYRYLEPPSRISKANP